MCNSIFLVIAILVGMKWYLFVTLISVSLITNDVEHFFMCFLVICIYYLEKCLSKIFAHLKIGLFVFLLLCYWNSLYIIDIKPLLRYVAYKYF